MKSNFPKKVFFFLLAIIALLLIMNIGSYYHVLNNGLTEKDYFFDAFNFDNEKNFPTIFSSILHFLSAVILVFIGFSKLKIAIANRFWYLLSLLFLFLGLDELLRIHEMLSRYISSLVRTSGIFHYSWVIPYGIAVLFIAWVCLKSLYRLPKKTSFSFILAGIIFVLGALGLEMFTGWYIENASLETTNLALQPTIFILYTLEELLEMLGMSYFIFSLLNFIKNYTINLQIFNFKKNDSITTNY